jgi:hypothetical protein
MSHVSTECLLSFIAVTHTGFMILKSQSFENHKINTIYEMPFLSHSHNAAKHLWHVVGDLNFLQQKNVHKVYNSLNLIGKVRSGQNMNVLNK